MVPMLAAWIVAMLVIALAAIAFGSLVILIRRDRGKWSERFWLSLGIAIVIVLIVFVLATLSDQW